MADDTFQIRRHSTFKAELTWPNGTGGAADLTGFTVSIEEQLNCEGLIADITDPANGIITLFMSDEDTGKIKHTADHNTFKVKVEAPDGTACATNVLKIEAS